MGWIRAAFKFQATANRRQNHPAPDKTNVTTGRGPYAAIPSAGFGPRVYRGCISTRVGSQENAVTLMAPNILVQAKSIKIKNKEGIVSFINKESLIQSESILKQKYTSILII